MSNGKPVKISAAKVEAMDIGEVMWDALVTGLHVRAGARNKSFMFAYRTLNGQRRCPAMGRYGVEIKSVDHARDIAQAWALQVSNGGDPSLEKEAKRAAGPAATIRSLKKKWEEEIAIAKKRRKEEDTAINSNELEDLQIIKKKKRKGKTDLADLASNTIDGYESRWKHIIEHFGEDAPLTDMTDEEIDKLHTKLVAKSKDPKTGRVTGGHITANRTLTFICTLINLGKDWKMIDLTRPTPTKEVSAFVEHGRERPMTEDELRRFLKVVVEWMQSKDSIKKRMARLASLCLVCGTRSGEFKTSRLSWINWQAKLLKVPKAKGDNWKTIPLGDVAIFILKQRLEEWETDVKAGKIKPEHDWIIPGKYKDEPLKATKRAWTKLLKAAGIAHTGKKAKLNLHDLRHTFITRMVNTGSGSQDQAGKIVGHKNRETTDGYSHLMVEPARAAINKTYQDFELLLKPAPQAVSGRGT